jgi:putative transcriptional regulator
MIQHLRFTLLTLLLAGLAPSAAVVSQDRAESLAGKLLVAAPSMPDPRFQKTVIYMCLHDGSGALGLIVNRRMGDLPASAVAEQFGLDVKPSEDTVRLHWGGPVEPGRGFVLHSSEYQSESTEPVGPGIAFSVDNAILSDLVSGEGPERVLLVLGYSGWGAGQLESELKRDDWLVVPADAAFVFDEDFEGSWEAALQRVEVDL